MIEDVKLIEPSHLNDGDRVYIYSHRSEDGRFDIWRKAVVVCAMGNHARVACRRPDGTTLDSWYHLRQLRIREEQAP